MLAAAATAVGMLLPPTQAFEQADPKDALRGVAFVTPTRLATPPPTTTAGGDVTGRPRSKTLEATGRLIVTAAANPPSPSGWIRGTSRTYDSAAPDDRRRGGWSAFGF
jgi:hypothetical protein